MTQISTIEVPSKDLHLVYSDSNRRGFNHAFLQQHIAQNQGVQLDQVQLQPPFVFNKKKGSLTFSWRLNH
jgi:hypothetical protein